MVGSRIGKYRLVRQLGEGGMGVVYEAVREDIAARAAIKVLRPEYAANPELAGRFFNEARAANLIAHPGIVRVFDYGAEEGGIAYLAMEYLDGESLWKRIDRHKKLALPEALRIARQIASALAAAHDKQIVHRDLKPDNIFVVPDSEAPGGERIKLLDFGIAKMADEYRGAVRTQLNYIMGTPAYMSPEQCRGSKGIGAPVDVYALGVILFEMLSGRAPFVAVEPGDYLAMHMLQPPPRLSDLVPNLPPPLIEMGWKMLAKEPTERPTMAQVADLLRRLLWMSGEAITVDGKVQEPGYFGESGRVYAESGRMPLESARSPAAAALAPPAGSREVSQPNALAPTVTAPTAASGPVLSPDLAGKPGRLQALVAEAIAPPPTEPPAPAPVSPSGSDAAAAQRLADAATMIRTPSGQVKSAAQSNPIWEPMEIVKTDYNSSPGVLLRSLKTPTPKPKPVAPAPVAKRSADWLWWMVLALAIVLSVLLARVLPR
jgi:serine/threonine protein kinase